jgi:hypothetical protein
MGARIGRPRRAARPWAHPMLRHYISELLGTVGGAREHLWVLDLQTGEVVCFRAGSAPNCAQAAVRPSGHARVAHRTGRTVEPFVAAAGRDPW